MELLEPLYLAPSVKRPKRLLKKLNKSKDKELDLFKSSSFIIANY